MSVFADTTSDDPTQDFYDISWCDGQLDQAPNSVTITASTGDYTAFQVLYPAVSPSSSGIATAQRLFTLVNTSTGLHWDFPILVLPIDASVDGTNPFTGHDITGNGETWLDTGVTPNVITVAYDTSNAGGLGIFAFDTGGTPISFPRGVLLYHELSHAFHLALNNFPFAPGQASCTAAQNASDEPQAEADENVMRAQLGLCARAVCNHGGGKGAGSFCGGKSRPACAGSPSGGSSGGGGGGGGGGCFIVSAATGSPHSTEVRRLQEIRAHIGTVSPLGGRVVNEILREYYRFSPEIAAHLEKDELVKSAVLTIIVRPLIAWFTLVNKLGLERADPNSVSQAAQDLLDVCPRSLGVQVAPFLTAIRDGGPLPDGVPRQLLEFLPRAREVSQLPFASWAILDALVRAWTITTRHVDVLSEVGEWLATVPLETLTPPGCAKLLDTELNSLAGFFDFKPSARRQLGARLAQAWPWASAALKHHNFIE